MSRNKGHCGRRGIWKVRLVSGRNLHVRAKSEMVGGRDLAGRGLFLRCLLYVHLHSSCT